MHLKTDSDPSIVARVRSTWEVLRRVFHYLKPYKWMAFGTILCAVVSLGFGLVFPKLLQYIVDDVINQGRRDLLLPITGGIIGAFFLRDLFNWFRIMINNHFEQNVIFDMRCELYSKLQRLPVGYFDQRASGDLMTRVIEDVNTVERVLIDGTEQGTVATLSIVAIMTILITSNPMLAGLALVPMPILFGAALWYTTTAHKRYRAQRLAASEMNALLMDNLQGIRQIKAFTREEHEDDRFGERADRLRQGMLGVMRAWAVYSPGMNFAASLGMGLVLWVGGSHVLNGVMTTGQLTAFVVYLMMFYAPVNRLHGLNQMVAATRAAGERVFDILDFEMERPHEAALKPLSSPVRGEVIYENVCFRYNAEREVLKNISLHARPGEMIALVGPTGAGKSTLVDLLAGFYELDSGRIVVDGRDVAEVTLESLRERIAVVTQEPFLFNGTIRENIVYGRLDAGEEEVVSAAKAANCHEFISRLPEGYEARVGERGVKLSVGEKQRISIARAILKNAPLLILDEATASVDTQTERLIQEALEHLMEGRTSFVIAHRLSTIRSADQILVLKNGEIVERGNHQTLLEQGGLYSKLARIQNTTFIEEGFERLSALR